MKHSRPTSRAAVVACAVAALSAAAPTAASAAATGSSSLTLSTASGAGKALKSAGVKVQAVKPATVRRSALTLPTSAVTLGATPTVRHGGAIRFTKGKRKITFTGLRTTLGTAPAITGAAGGKRVTLFTLRGGTIPQVDTTTGSATTTGTSVVLTSAAATRIKSALKLRRLNAGAFGRASVTGTDTAAATAPKLPAPAPTTPPAPAPQPGTPTPTPDPPPPTTPATGQTRWFSSGLPSSGSHRSFIEYVTGPMSICGFAPPGAVTLSGGIVAAPPPADGKLDFLVDQIEATATTLTHRGRVRYTMGCHGLDQWVENLVFADLDRATGRVLADGSHGDRDNPSAPDVVYADRHLLNLDLAGATVTTEPDGDRVYTDVDATVAAGAQDELGKEYPAGTPWGSFTFTLPKVP